MSLPMAEIVGNEKLRRRLCDDILSEKNSHAYILSGPDGSGKRTIALMYAAALACENKGLDGFSLPCGKCPSCRKILELKSPDVFIVERDSATVKIAQIREILSTIRVVPNELDHKVYIIENAETMTPQAQNSILLTLEEPPSYVVFFLLCESEEKLLETIKSRAPIFRTEPIDADKIREHLISRSSDAKKLAESNPEELDAVISIANGSIGKALELTDEKTRLPLVQRRQLAEKFIDFTLNKKTVKLVDLVTSFQHKQDELLPLFTYAETALRDLILLKQNEDAVLCFYTDREAATDLSYSTSISTLFAIYDKISKTKETLTRNANIKLTLSTLLANII